MNDGMVLIRFSWAFLRNKPNHQFHSVNAFVTWIDDGKGKGKVKGGTYQSKSLSQTSRARSNHSRPTPKFSTF